MNQMYWASAYIASPFFTPEQLEAVKDIEQACEENGVQPLSPRQFLVLKPGASFSERLAVFKDNTEKMKECTIMLAVVDGKDVGTMWEMGYAYAIGRPVVALSMAQTRMNVMLACGTKGFLEGMDDLRNFLRGHNTGAQGADEGKPWDFNWNIASQWLKGIY